MDKQEESGSRKRKLPPNYKLGENGDKNAELIISFEIEQILDVLKLKNNEANIRNVSSKLEKHLNEENRVLLVINELLNGEIGTGHDANSSDIKKRRADSPEDSFFSDLTLVITTLKIQNPDTPVDENIAYETLLNYSQQKDRVNLTVTDILNSGKPKDSDQLIVLSEGEVEEDEVKVDEGECIIDDDDDDQTIQQNANISEEMRKMNALMEMLTNVFPDVRRSWLQERVYEHMGNPQCLEVISLAMTERQYPKEEWKAGGPTRQELEDRNFDDEEFLKMFPDPQVQFYRTLETKTTRSDSYVRNALYRLVSDFTMYKIKHIERVFSKTLSYATTAKSLLASSSKSKRKDRERICCRPAEYEVPPDVVDEGFFKELWFVKNEERILKLVAKRKLTRATKMEVARSSGMLTECPICCDDEVLPDETLSCTSGHEFCSTCVRRSTEVAIGEGITRFQCLVSGECKGEFTPSSLLSIMPRSVYDKVLDKKLEQESKALCEEISDLVQCPFCVYMVSMPNPEDKVLRCMNPDCLKETCRLCKELNHIPLRCDEVEKEDEMIYRKKLEMEMTEAMVRVCPRCKKRFFKVEGCNKMTCACGTTMCYLCRMPNIDYSHFGDGKCSLHSNTADLHVIEVSKAAEKVKIQFSQSNPNLILKHDPASNNVRQQRKRSSIDSDRPLLAPRLQRDLAVFVTAVVFCITSYFFCVLLTL